MIYSLCADCGGQFPKPLTTNYRNGKIYQSRSRICKFCRKERALEYYYKVKRNKIKYLNYLKKRQEYLKKPEIKIKRKEYYKIYRKKFPRKQITYSHRYYLLNTDKILATNKAWRDKNRVPKWKFKLKEVLCAV